MFLFGANLENASLVAANLSGASFFKANMSQASLREANLEGADLSGAKLENITWPRGWKLVREAVGNRGVASDLERLSELLNFGVSTREQFDIAVSKMFEM